MLTSITHRSAKPLFLIPLFLFVGLSLTSAQPGRGFISGKLADNPKVKEALDLTDEQSEAIKEGMREIDRKQIEVRKDCELLRLDLEAAYDADEIDADKVRDLNKKLAEAHARQFELQAERRLLMATTLTPEQREKGKEKLREFMRRGDRPMRRAIRHRSIDGRRGGQAGQTFRGPRDGFGPRDDYRKRWNWQSDNDAPRADRPYRDRQRDIDNDNNVE